MFGGEVRKMRNEHTARSPEPTLVKPVSAQADDLAERSPSGDSAAADPRSAASKGGDDAMTTENATVAELTRADGEPPEAARVTALEAQLAEAAVLYRELALAAHPEVPAEMVAGATPQEVAAALATAKATVAQVRQRLAAQAASERVPAGAPARRGIDPTSLSSRDKIAYGLSQRTE